MAIEGGFCGFELGSNGAVVNLNAGVIVGDGTARTGEFYCKQKQTTAALNNPIGFPRVSTSIGSSLSNGEQVKGIIRAWVRFRARHGTSGAAVVGWAQNGSDAYRGWCAMDTSGHFAAAAFGTVGTYSSAVLALDTWYRIEVTSTVTKGASNNTLDVSVSVYNEAGSLIETVTRSDTNITSPTFPGPGVGNSSFTSSTSDVDFDDCVWVWGDKADVGNVTLPSAMRIHRVMANAQGASAGWTGDYRNVAEAPLDRDNTATDQSTSTNGASTTFSHATAATLGLTSIAAVKVYAYLKGSSSGTDALLINGTEYNVTTPATSYTSFACQQATDFNSYSDSAFNAMEFGAHNKRGVSIQLGMICMEVLHTGSGPSAPTRTGSWKHKVFTYTGDGSWRTITTPGFAPDVIIIKKLAGSNSLAGGFWTSKMGGTRSLIIESATVISQGITGATETGFTLGPHVSVNQSGVTYVALCLADAGGLNSGKFLDHGAYVGDGVDNKSVATGSGWQPEFVLLGGNSSMVLRTDNFVGDSSLKLGTSTSTANMIQALNATGFEVGTDADVNGLRTVYYWVGIRKWTGQIDTYIKWGTFTPSSLPHTLTGLPFVPDFVLVDSPTGGHGHFRQADAHSGTNSTPWAGGSVGTTGITALTADGFTIGSTFTAAAAHYYLTFFEVGAVATDMPDYWTVGYNNDAANPLFPVVRTLVCKPSLYYSEGRTPTYVSGTGLTNYPAAQMTDGSLQVAARIAETTLQFTLDLGSLVTPNFIGFFNTNIDEGLVVQVEGASNSSFTNAELRAGVAARQPNFWLDLRGFNVSVRYIKVTVTGNSRAVAIGEFIVGAADIYNGVIDAGHEVDIKAWQERHATDYGVAARVISGSISRTLNVSLLIVEEERTTLEAALEHAGLNGGRVVVVPTTNDNDIWLCEMGVLREIVRRNHRESVVRLELLEESPGVI